jgi:hypothetical protein
MGQTTPEVMVWADDRSVPLVRQVLGQMGMVRVLGVGAPRKGQVADLAAELDAPAGDDLRAMLAQAPPEYLLLASSSEVTAQELAQAHASGTITLALEPVPFEVNIADEARPGSSSAMIAAPWWRMSPTWLKAADPQQALGEIRSINAAALSTPDAGSLFARLHDVLEMIISLRGLPESVDASITGHASCIHDDLRRIAGHLTAHLRFGQHASAVIHISDRAPCWHRSLQIVGDQGMLELNDRHYRLLAADGRILDESSPPAATSSSTSTPTGDVDVAQLIVRQWRRILDGSPAPEPVQPRQVLACCQAVSLSCRTASPESPQTLLRMIEG